MRNRLKALAIAFIVMAGGFVAHSAQRSGADSTAVNTDENDVALGGYDAVAYLRDGVAREGRRAYRIRHGGAVYRFASADSMAAFSEARARYLPEYGGFCAYGVRMGRKLPIDPTAYDVVDGKLYVFLDRATMLTWQEDRAANIAIANKIWPDLADAE